MSHPITHDWFSLSVRRNRMSFIGANVALGLILALVEFALVSLKARQNTAMLIYVIFYIPYIIAFCTLVAQRFRDLNLSGWYALSLWVFPVVVAVGVWMGLFTLTLLWLSGYVILAPLYCLRGSKGLNRYGDDCLA
jgi:uncharacterized membrane protein YhaH (DUF805 family)